MAKPGPKPFDIAGKRFSRLVAVRRTSGGKWLFQCDCGNSKEITIGNVLRERDGIKSCGCLAASRRVDPAVRAERNRAQNREYHKQNRAIITARRRARMRERRKERMKDPEVRARFESYNRRYATTDRAKKTRREYANARRKSDANFKLAYLLRTRLIVALKRAAAPKSTRAKSGAAIALLGCTVDEARAHLESLFQPGMSWANHGEWHIDHVRPLALFHLNEPAQLAEACHYTNLQPLWKAANLSKSKKYKP